MITTFCLLLHTCVSEYHLCIHSLVLTCVLGLFFFSVTYHESQCSKHKLLPAVYPSCVVRKEQSSFLGLFQILWKLSWENCDLYMGLRTAWRGYWEKDRFQLKGGESVYLFTSKCKGSCGNAGVLSLHLDPLGGHPCPTSRSVPNAHGMNGMLAEGET